MVEKYKNIIAAIILGVCLVISAYFIAISDRYYIQDGYRVDKWSGTYQKVREV